MSNVGFDNKKSRGGKLRLLGKIFLLLILAAALAFLFRKPILTRAARAWAVNEPVITADSIIVLGGSADVRATAAAEMYKGGVSNIILVMNVALTEIEKAGSPLARPILFKLSCSMPVSY